MAVTESVRAVDLRAAALGFLDLRGIEQRRDNCGRSDADCYPRFHKLGPSLIFAIAHSILSLECRARSYSERSEFGSFEASCVAA